MLLNYVQLLLIHSFTQSEHSRQSVTKVSALRNHGATLYLYNTMDGRSIALLCAERSFFFLFQLQCNIINNNNMVKKKR